MRKVLAAIVGLGFLAGLGSGAYAFNCPVDLAEAEAAIAKAKTAMDAMPDGEKR
jgi:hypothetical protein